MLNKKQKYNVAVVGATGIVGESLLKILHSRKFPISDIIPIASKKSEGNKVKFGDELLTVQSIKGFSFDEIDIAFFSAGSEVSKKFVPHATNANCVVIDNTSEFRYVENIPLIIPEVNSNQISAYKETNIIANPNCSTTQMVMALKPLHDYVKIKRVVVSTYQSTSGAGRLPMDELFDQTKNIFANKQIKKEFFTKQIAFNVIPHIDSFLDGGETKEEWKMRAETQKILDKSNLKILSAIDLNDAAKKIVEAVK